MRILTLGAYSVASTFFAAAVSAATLTASSADVEYIEPFAGEGELSVFLADIDGFSGLTLNGFATLDIVASFGTSDPTDTLDFAFGGFLDVSDDDGQFLVGDLSSISFGTDVIELGFNNLSGNGAGSFGSSVLASIALAGFGSNPFSFFSDGDLVSASVSVTDGALAPVPLPAGLPLLLVGIGGLAALRRRQQTTQ